MSSMTVGETSVTVAQLLEALSEEGSIDGACERLRVNQLDAVDALQRLSMRLKLFETLLYLIDVEKSDILNGMERLL